MAVWPPVIPPPPGTITLVQKYADTTDDLCYNILLALGGTDMDIEQKYYDTTDDLLYAILKKITGGGGSGGSDGTMIKATSADFANSTDYLNAVLTGKTIYVYLNEINRYLEPSEFTTIAGGIRILLGGFDTTVNSYTLYIFYK